MMYNYFNVKSPAQEIAKERASQFGLHNHGLTKLGNVYWNLPSPALYEEALFRRECRISHLGPMIVDTGKHTARAANDKFVVKEASTDDRIWWGQYNRPFSSD